MTIRVLPSTALLALALSACDAGPAADEATRAAAAVDQSAVDQSAADQPAADVPPAVAPAAGRARFDGYGEARFGMTADEVRQAWGDGLSAVPDARQPCYYLRPDSSPTASYFALMIEGGKFVRYDVGNDGETAPGGGRRGMDADAIRALYPGRVEERPHKYVPGGKYLRIADDGGGVLVFETDAAGKVTSWRVGQPPQADYIEGCS